ncbi:glucan biosynthesis protein [Neotabrizicola sp. VNH66]|uniref:glucan biosynthesis protein n=1 Tax=Neotabrizicola sp. VNH66 TaxID=3400918 RepID=UPI003C05350C
MSAERAIGGISRRGALAWVMGLAAGGMLPRLATAQETAAPPAADALTDAASGVSFGPAEPFADGTVEALARALAQEPYAEPRQISDVWKGLTYDQIREIWYDGKHALYTGSDSPTRAEMFVAGLYQHYPIDIFAVQGAEAREVLFNLDLFVKTDRFPDLPGDGTGFSGFRLTGEMEQPGVFQEYAVFQGATYFRAVGRGQQYGLSARGFALNTAHPSKPEEFPLFTRFWIEEGKLHATEAVVHALMDSPSLTGAYRFTIRKGDATVMEVEAVVFPRETLDAPGIAPETSMFLFNDLNRLKFDDFREGVHDSDGLLVATGTGNLLWRPLMNPAKVETSWFADTNPRGFGLMQRARDPGAYNDLAAHYERRPSLWVEPVGDWGEGHVVLVEIPADKEIYDNIVAFWRPKAPMETGQEYRFSYRLHWADGAPPVDGERARVIATRTGQRVFEDGRMFAIDYEAHPALGTDPAALEAKVTASAGQVTGVLVLPNPDTGGFRVDATLILPEDQPVELRVELMRGGVNPVGETWLYRWVP